MFRQYPENIFDLFDSDNNSVSSVKKGSKLLVPISKNTSNKANEVRSC